MTMAIYPDPSQPVEETDPVVNAQQPAPMRRPAIATTPAAAVRQGQPFRQPGGGGLLSLIGLGGDQGGQSSSLADRLGWGSNSGSYDDDFRSRLNKLGAVMMMLDPMSRDAGTALLGLEQNRAQMRMQTAQANQTVQWLVNNQHMDPQEAMMLARDPAALREWYKTMTAAKMPKWEYHEMFNAQGQKTQVRVDVNSGKYQVMGGAEAPTLTYGEAYDDQGRTTHVLINPHDPHQAPIQVGGAKPDVLSPAAEQQQIRLKQAERPSIVMQGEGAESKAVGEMYGGAFGKYRSTYENAQDMLSNLDMMEGIVRSPGFQSGVGTEFKTQAQSLLKQFGFTDDQVGKTGDKELLTALSGRMTLQSLGGSLGTGISNEDRNMIKGTVPNLEKSPGGNLALIEIQRAVQHRAEEVWQLALNYRAEHHKLDENFDQMLFQWRDQHPIMTPEFRQHIIQLAQTPTSPGGGGGGGGNKPPKSYRMDANGNLVEIQ